MESSGVERTRECPSGNAQRSEARDRATQFVPLKLMSHRWRYIVVEPRVRIHCVYNIKWAEMRGRDRSAAISESLQGG